MAGDLRGKAVCGERPGGGGGVWAVRPTVMAPPAGGGGPRWAEAAVGTRGRMMAAADRPASRIAERSDRNGPPLSLLQNPSGSASSLVVLSSGPGVLSLGGLSSGVKADHESELPRVDMHASLLPIPKSSHFQTFKATYMRHLDLCERWRQLN